MMDNYAFPYAETIEDFSSVRHDASPSVNTPILSDGGTPSSPLIGSHNEFEFGQPSHKIYGSTREHFPKSKEHSDGRTNREARHWQQQSNRYQKDLEQCRSDLERCRSDLEQCRSDLEQCRSEKKDQSIQLFQCLKDQKKYDKAEELYYEILKKYDVGEELHDLTERGRGPDTKDDTKILGLNHTFAEMLIEQQKFAEAEPRSRAVWERRKHCPGTPSEDIQKSHRQLCSVLRARGNFKDAERMHNDMYQREPKDDWALENGDEVCQTLKEQKEFRKAKDLQEEVWKTRLEKRSPRELTIQSSLRLIGFLEELGKPSDYVGGTEAEKRLASSARQAWKDELEVTLREIWRTRLQPEPNANILDVGHKLGVLLFQDRKFLEAEEFLASVWESKKRELGETNESTMSSGSMLGSTILRQGTQGNYSKAVDILRPIFVTRQEGTGSCNAETISSIRDLAQAYYALGKLQDSEIVYDWICHQMQQGDYKALEVERVRWELGITLHKQGKDKNQKAILVLKEMYERWKREAHNPDETLTCGQMLAQSLSNQDGKTDEALMVAQDVFEKREVSERRGVAYLESAQLYGSLLLEVGRYEDAGSVLHWAWECQPGNPQEQKLRLKCGHLFGQALAGRHKYSTAKRTLEAVAATLTPGSPELKETRQLLEDVIQQEKVWKKGRTRTKARPKG